MRRIGLALITLVILGGIVFVFSQRQTRETQAPQTQSQTEDSETASKECSGEELVQLTEGPYYKSGSPERQDITEEGTPGTNLILKGYVFDTDCEPIENAWLDFWQADGQGNYDNEGYNLRGHQYTDENGFFRIETVLPAEYGGRTPHIHFKVRASETSPVITSQLFFPESSEANSQDSIFDKSLLVNIGTDPDGSKFADFNIVIPN